VLENPESGQWQELPGSALMGEGLTIEITPRSGAAWFYHRKT